MTDTAQLREALEIYDARRAAFEASSYRVSTQRMADAARELLTLREAGALIITRDEKTVLRLKQAIRDYAWDHLGHPTNPFDAATCAQLVLDALRDAMPDGET